MRRRVSRREYRTLNGGKTVDATRRGLSQFWEGWNITLLISVLLFELHVNWSKIGNNSKLNDNISVFIFSTYQNYYVFSGRSLKI